MVGGRDSEPEPDWRDDAEADKLRDEAFRRLLDVPPKPPRDMKLGKGRKKRQPDESAGRADDDQRSGSIPEG